MADDALLPRLAELAEASGKWPPAPAYKGPVVPAAELDAVRDALDGLDSDLGDDATLGARVQELHESYLDMVQLNGRWIDEISQLKRDRDLALWLHAEALWQRDGFRDAYQTVVDYGVWLQARIDSALVECVVPAGPERLDIRNVERIGRIRAALQGDQPAGPPDFAEVRGELADGRRFTGRVDLRPARELADRLDAEYARQTAAKHVYEDDAAHNWEGICRVCSYPPGGPQHLDAPVQPTGEADRG